VPGAGTTIAMQQLLGKLDSAVRLPAGRRTFLAYVLLGFFALQAVVAALLNSGACDELAAHIPAGWLYVESGQFSGGIDNFPLGQVLIALPTALLGRSYTLWTEQHLFLFRLPVILMGLGTCLLVWRLGRRIFGEAAGLVALVFAAFCPNLLAHATLATLDLPAAFFILLSVWLLDRYLELPDGRRMLAFAAAISAATLVKVQAYFLLPYAFAVLALHLPTILRRQGAWGEQSGEQGERSAARATPPSARENPRVSRRGEASASRLLPWLWLPAIWLLLVHLTYRHAPFAGGHALPPLFLETLAGLRVHQGQGHFGYLLGHYSMQGWWYYFPVAIAVKTPVATLILASAGLFAARSRRAHLLVTAPLLLFLVAAMAGRINIGLRHVLMLYPFLAIAAGAGAVWGWEAFRARMVWVRGLVAVLLASYVGHAAFIAPHYLSYFNLPAGGAKGGHRVLIDSNYDWGTNDRFLRSWLAGAGRPVEVNPYAFRPVAGTVAVSANALYGVLNGGEKAYAWLKEREPVERVAYTWFIYDVPAGVPRGPEEDREALAQIVAHLSRLRAGSSRVGHPGFGTIVGRGLAEARAYDLAFDMLRQTLAAHPGYAPALYLGGELVTRWKLGVLDFRGREYLDGVRTPPVDVVAGGDLERTIALARRSGRAAGLARVHAELGMVLAEAGDPAAAAGQARTALRFDPENGDARALLDRLGTRPGS